MIPVEEWRDDALCLRADDPRIFDPPEGYEQAKDQRLRVLAARAWFCTPCTVSDRCAAAQITGAEQGIWAGVMYVSRFGVTRRAPQSVNGPATVAEQRRVPLLKVAP